MHTADCLLKLVSFENMYYNLLHHPKFELNCIQRKKETEYAGSKFCYCQNNVSTSEACFYRGERG